MEDKKYNGFTNRETWLASLWLNTYREIDAQIRLYVRLTISKGYEDYKLEGKISQFIEETLHYMAEDAVYVTNGLMYELMMNAVLSVNTAEIAENYIDEVKEDLEND